MPTTDVNVKDLVTDSSYSCRKKAEQAAARNELKEAREAGVDVDGGSAGGNVRGGVQVD